MTLANAEIIKKLEGMDQEANLFLQASALARRVPIYSLQLSDGVKPMQQALEKVDLLAPSSLEAEPTVGLDASAEAQEEAR